MKPKICSECEKKFPKNEIKRINKKWICIFCWRKNRDNKRDHILHTIGGVRRKEDIMKETKERRERYKKLRRVVTPSIPSARIPKKRTPGIGLYLTREEKYVLYIKYKNNGYDSKEIKNKINGIVERLGILVKSLRKKGKEEEEVNKRFKEEFAKLCSE